MCATTPTDVYRFSFTLLMFTSWPEDINVPRIKFSD